jgi:hypothetical protein
MGRQRARMIIPSGHEFSGARLCNANRQCNCLDEAQTELQKATQSSVGAAMCRCEDHRGGRTVSGHGQPANEVASELGLVERK